MMKSRAQYQTLKVNSRCNGIDVASGITFDFLQEIQYLDVIYYNPLTLTYQQSNRALSASINKCFSHHSH
jgi:hypothetical protein